MKEWINKRSRIYWYDQYALNEQETAFARYDPDRITQELVETGADIIAVYAANQFGISYYPSDIWPQHPGLKGRDYVGDLVSRLRARGKKVLLYINWLDSKHAEWNAIPLGRENDPAYKEQRLVSWADLSKPNWRIQSLPGGKWKFPCINSPQREQIVAITREIVERYHPDAFHLDMFLFYHVCVCDYCRPVLEKICGTKEITREAIEANWKKFIDWRCQTSASLISAVSTVLREHDIIAAHNAFAPLYIPADRGQDAAWLEALDIFLSECFDAFMSPSTDLNSTSINVRWQHAIGKPSWILRTSTQGHYAHWPISRAQWQIHAAACKANGCKAFGPCGVGAYPDTTSSKKLLANVKAGFDFYMTDADLDEDAVSAAKIGLVFSWATRKYYGAGANDHWLEEFVGWARLLIEEHLPYDILAAESTISVDDIAKYDLIVLPNTANLSNTFCSLLRDYVSKGGRILATAESSLWDDEGGKRSEFELSDILGISSKGCVEGLFAIERPIEPEPASGISQQIEALGNIICRYVSVDPAGSVSGSMDPLPAETIDTPAAVSNTFGKGRAVYIAFDIGRFYENHGDEHIGTWMAELVDDILPARQLTLKAPRTVEVTVWHQEKLNRTIVHLANRTVPWTLPTKKRQITEIIPLRDIELAIESPCENPSVTCRGAEIHHRIDRNRLVVSVSKLDAYAAVLITGK